MPATSQPLSADVLTELKGIIDPALDAIDRAIDLVGEDAVVAYLSALYDKHIVPLDIPYVPDVGEAVIDAIARLLPGVLGDMESAETDSFYQPNRLGWPVFTRPQVFEGKSVPEVLVSGHHENIRRWRVKAGLELTRSNRPDLFGLLELTNEEKKLLEG